MNFEVKKVPKSTSSPGSLRLSDNFDRAWKKKIFPSAVNIVGILRDPGNEVGSEVAFF